VVCAKAQKKGRCKGNDTERKVEDAQADCAGKRPQIAGMEEEKKGGGGMKLTDAEAIKALRKVRCYDLEMMISDYPEDERDGRTDWEMIANEAGWLLDGFRSDDHANHEALEEAKELIRATKNGTVFPGLLTSIQVKSYQVQVQDARDLINMVKRLERFVQKLKGMGLYCPYC
jgi:hypothetical protein